MLPLKYTGGSEESGGQHAVEFLVDGVAARIVTVVFTQVVAAEQVDIGVCAARQHQVLRDAVGVGLVRKQQRGPGSEVDVVLGLRSRVPHREVIGHGQTIAGAAQGE